MQELLKSEPENNSGKKSLKSQSRFKRKVKEWLHRYGWAEVLSTALTYLFGWISTLMTTSEVAQAYAGTIGAALGFYGFIFGRDIVHMYRSDHPHTFREWMHLLARVFRNMGFDFGISEILDVVIVRPFFLFYGPKVLNNYFWGILLGKTAADIIFFAISILMYEIRKKHLNWK